MANSTKKVEIVWFMPMIKVIDEKKQKSLVERTYNKEIISKSKGTITFHISKKKKHDIINKEK